MPTLEMWSYNCAPGRRVGAVAAEIRAILSTGPAVLALQETIGYGPLPNVPDYTRFRDRTGGPFGGQSRANVAAYVLDELIDLKRAPRWRDLAETWPMPKHGGKPHPPRSWLEVPTRFQCIVGHQPPQIHVPGAAAIVTRTQNEGIEYLVGRLHPEARVSWDRMDTDQRQQALDRPRVVLADWNRGPREDGPGPKSLAERIGGRVVGEHIDAAVVRGDCQVTDPGYVQTVKGVHLGTDHPDGAFRFGLVVDKKWAA